MKSEPTHKYVRAGAWWILLDGFREDPRRAITEFATGVMIFAALFVALYLKEIMLWIWGVLG